MTHHSLGVNEEEVLLGVVLHSRQDVLAGRALGLSNKEVPVLWGKEVLSYSLVGVGKSQALREGDRTQYVRGHV